ncbi:MAG: WG repeat-containing protein [Carboxydocellales bacterium]
MRKINLYPALVQTVEGVKWGYIDNNGKFVLLPQYEAAEDFQDNGLAIVQIKGKFGVIDLRGNFVVEPKYGSIIGFTEGRAAVVDDQGFKVIDEQGQVLTDKAYSFIGMYQEGRAVVANTDSQGNYLYGYLDLLGKEVIPLQYRSADDFVGGKAVVQVKDYEYALIGLYGETLARYNYAFVGNLGEGLLAFKLSQNFEGLFGYIDEQGKVVQPPQYSSAGPFHEGRAVVNTSTDILTNQYGLIDRKGNLLIKPVYNDLLYLGEGRVAAGKALDSKKPYMGSKYAIANLDGNILSNFIFSSVEPYKEGLASATDGNKTFFIDRGGRVAQNLPIVKGSGTVTFVGALVKANVDYHLSYYLPNGSMVWQQNTIIPLNSQYRVREEKYKPNKDYLVYYPQIEGMVDRTAQKKANKKLAELSRVIPVKSNAQLDYTFDGNFAIEFFCNKLLVLQLSSYRFPYGAAHGMPSELYPHVDLVSGRFYQLKALFMPGSNYVQVLSDIIGYQIIHNPEYSYVFPDSYHGIKPDQPFYVSEHILSIYFFPYEIAPYAAGFPTFRIPFAAIMGIINVQGNFWRAFH